MAFAVICKSCQARFLLNDDLLRRKVAGRVVTVRCRQCHATIEVDASDVDPKRLQEAPKPKGARPAPPRPLAKSTLMGIGEPRPQSATELVALSPGLLDVQASSKIEGVSPHGYPEPPPPPGVLEVLDPGDWDVEGPPPRAAQDTVPVSVDDFIEELPPSIPPEEELPSSTGTPSLKALTHHEQATEPHVDDFLLNMSAATNGGLVASAPTIDVSELTTAPAAATQAPSIDISGFDTPARGAKTLAQFEARDFTSDTPRSGTLHPAPVVEAEGSLSPAALDPAPSEGRADSARERKHVVAPEAKSAPPTAAPRRSGLAAPLLLALAAAAGFLIWKRSGAPLWPEPAARPEQPAERAPEPPAPELSPPPTTFETAAATETADDVTFETAPGRPRPAGASGDKTAAVTPAAAGPRPEAEPEPAAPATEPEPAPKPPAEPAGPFDREAAAAALTSSATEASSCRKEGEPSGVASVIVTFSPSGRVTSASIGGPPFAGTATGGCIASVLRKTRIPAFEGERVTVSKTVVIQ